MLVLFTPGGVVNDGPPYRSILAYIKKSSIKTRITIVMGGVIFVYVSIIKL